MLFHTFRVVYTVKELYSHANHGQSLKKTVYVYLCAKNLTSGSYKFRENVFFDRGSC